LRRFFLAAALLSLGGSAHAEIALLTNGMTLKVTGWRQEGDTTWLSLKDGGEVGAPSKLVQGFVPDEVIDEVLEAPAETVGGPRDLKSLAEAAAKRHGLDPALVLAVVAVESAFRSDAVSPKGAQGLMQLMPATAVSLGVTNPLDPEQNLEGGARHLEGLLAQYGGDLTRALAAYNAGAGAVSRHGGVPPYRETREYVKKVLRRYQSAEAEAKEKTE
jgi:soluble lytic murein transglycosylase-like protein